MKIISVRAREILDSRGNPTVEASVELAGGCIGVARAPSGASTGSHEAHEKRDHGRRYGGLGVRHAVKGVHDVIAPALKGFSVPNPRLLDHVLIELDGTPTKKRLGANAVLAVSLAFARASALQEHLPLYSWLREAYHVFYKDMRMPIPTINILNGGAHAGWNLDIQEYMVIPQLATMEARIRAGAEIFHALRDLLAQKGERTTVGDEGGFAPMLARNEDGFGLVVEAIRAAGYGAGVQVGIGVDIAASEFYDSARKIYHLRRDKKKLTGSAMVEQVKAWYKKYPLVSIEDPIAEDDWSHWYMLTQDLGGECVLVGDDLFVTNVERIRHGVEKAVANTVLIKPNQIGTLSETVDAILYAQQHGYAISVSHRSGETADTFIADLSVAFHADFIKSGSMSRSERIEKYNRLLEIEAELQG